MGRAACCEKKKKKKKKRGAWSSSPEEDHKLITHSILKHGGRHPNWTSLPHTAGLDRCGKSCRLRWTNYLRPEIKRGRFSFEEEEAIIQLHRILGNKWSAIAAWLPGRTDNEIKNYWNTHIRKRLLMMGIDPATHAPTLHLLHQLSSLLHHQYSSQLGLVLGSRNAFLGSELSSSPNQSPVQPNTDHHFEFGRYCAQPNEWEIDGVIVPPPLAGDHGGFFSGGPPQSIPADSRQLFDASALYPNDVVFSDSGFRTAVSFPDVSTPSSSSSAAAFRADDEIGEMLNLDGYPNLVEVDESFV